MPVHLDLNCVGGLKAPNKTSNVATRKTLNALSLAIAKSRRVVVVTGAGISCSSGIPVRPHRVGFNALFFKNILGFSFERWPLRVGQVAVSERRVERERSFFSFALPRSRVHAIILHVYC